MREREEKFCQAVVAGESYSRAYVTAGYPANRGNASRLANRPHIIARVAELRALLPPPEPATASNDAPEPSEDGGDQLAQLRRLREAGLANKQVNAAVAAEREAIRHKREQAKGKGAELKDSDLVKKILLQSRLSGAKIEKWQIERLMGMVAPDGKRPGPVAGNGHTKPV